MKESQAASRSVDGREGRNWTTPQAVAIAHGDGDLLVSAAAGSGKTAVLAERCARLVCEGSQGRAGGGRGRRCGVENLLVVTFTEAAAKEMRGRIAQAIQRRLKTLDAEHSAGEPVDDEQRRWLRRQSAMVERANISTLHGFCNRVLKQHFHEAGIDPGFEVIDEEEAWLLRDEVLEQLLAKWHPLPAESAEAKGFGDFFEGYAQGREAPCREMILRLHNMLASTADPAAYLASARQVYSAAGAVETMDRYVKETLGGKLRLAEMAAQLACAEVVGYPGTEKMHEGLAGAAGAIKEARDMLLREGAQGWGTVRNVLNYEWPKLKSVKEMDGFEELKERTWEATKELLKKLQLEFEGEPGGMVGDLVRIGSAGGPLETLIWMAGEFDAAYTAAKRAQNRVDFHDLERLTLDLLTKPKGVPGEAVRELQSQFHYVLVDEFQDINPLQAALLEAVRSPGGRNGKAEGNLFLVGDVKQSIYGFRLAEPGLFLERERAWKQDGPGDANAARYVALPHNFRSRPALLKVMNGLFGRLMTPEVVGVDYAAGHALVAGEVQGAASSANGLREAHDPVEVNLLVMQEEEPENDGEEAQGDQPQIESLSAVEQEARMVARRIAEMVAEGRLVRGKDGKMRRVEHRDIAILLRSVKSKAMIFARALAGRGIKAHADLSTGYFDTPEVRDTLALLQVLDNPKQDIPLATVMLGPYGGVGGGKGFSHDDLAMIRLTFDRKEVSFAEAVARYQNAECGMRNAKDEDGRVGGREFAGDAPSFSLELAARLDLFFAKLAAWREKLSARPLHEGLAEIYGESKFWAYGAGLEAAGTAGGGGDGRRRGGVRGCGGGQRVANLRMLHQQALAFGGFRKQGLHRFLRFIEKLRDARGFWRGSGGLRGFQRRAHHERPQEQGAGVSGGLCVGAGRQIDCGRARRGWDGRRAAASRARDRPGGGGCGAECFLSFGGERPDQGCGGAGESGGRVAAALRGHDAGAGPSGAHRACGEGPACGAVARAVAAACGSAAGGCAAEGADGIGLGDAGDCERGCVGGRSGDVAGELAGAW